MKKNRWMMALAVAALALPALAQDSTSTDPAIGDAVFPWQDASSPDGSEQINRYVVDLQQITSSWGNRFRVAPLVKASKTSFTFLNSLISAQAISNTLLDAPFPFSSYSVWNGPGFGVNGVWNLTPGTVNTAGFSGKQFATAFAEFSTGDEGGGQNAIIGAVVNYRPAEPHRLYVTRVTAAGNALSGAENRSQFGVGSIDSHGQVYFRADAFNVTGPDPLTGNNLFRVRLIDPDGAGPKVGRNGNVANIIDISSNDDVPATDWLLDYNNPESVNTTNPPCNIPQQVAGRPVLVGSNFTTKYVYEQSPYPAGLTFAPGLGATGHLAAGLTDHRGGVGFSHLLRCAPNSVGTLGMVALAAATTKATALALWDVDANGNVLNKYALFAPPTFSFPSGDTFGTPARIAEFTNYRGQTAFRGGNGPVAVGRDQAGRGLAAATMIDPSAFADRSSPGAYINPYNLIAVARFSCGGTPQWAVAAYIDQVSDSGTPSLTPSDPTWPNNVKDDVWAGSLIYGPGGTTPIGQLAPLWAIPNITTIGPSMSAPAIDSVGNIYFLSAYQLFELPVSYNTGLFRAVYDPATFSYKLELLLSYGQVLRGQNSNTPYRIQYLAINDGNSVSSGTLWSGNIIQAAFNGLATEGLATSDPRTLGGLVIQASIIYDSNGDGTFDGTLGVDERYTVLLYVGADAGVPLCPGDLDCNGVVDFDDIDRFVEALSYPGGAGWPYECPWANGDCNGDGNVNFDDIDPFVARIGSSCN